MSASASAAQSRGEIILDELQSGGDGATRSWIMLLPEGEYEHPKGTLHLDRKMLNEVKANFDKRVRGVDIALDYDHKAADGDSKAYGWIERIEHFAPGQAPLKTQPREGYPAGLWAQVRWTSIGLDAVRDQIYRYISAEYRPEWTNPVNKTTYRNVLVGATLTNRPFMNQMPAVQLSEVSTTSWGSIDKSKLPDSAFLDPKNRRLPIYEGSGEIVNGRYSSRGKLNINGVRAALEAVHGAHTGHAMSGLPSGIASRLQSMLDRYEGKSSDAGSGKRESTKMSNVRGVHMNRYLGTRDDSEEPDDNEREMDDMGDDTDSYDEGDMFDDLGLDDGDTDDEGSDMPDTDTGGPQSGEFPAVNSGGRSQQSGRRRPARSKEPVAAKEAAGSREMSERRKGDETVSLAEANQMREQIRDYALRLFELEIDKKIQLWETAPGEGAGAIVTTKAFNDAYRAFMLSEGFALSETARAEINKLLDMALAGTVELGQRSLASADMESRQTRRSGQGDDRQVVERIESIALQEFGKPWKMLQTEAMRDPNLQAQLREVVKQAWRETGYDPIKLSADIARGAGNTRLRD